MDLHTCGEDLCVVVSQSLSDGDSPLIRVTAGEGTSAKDFLIHKDLLCSRSEFFTRALNGSWKKASDRAVPLPEDDPKVSAIYSELLSTYKLVISDTRSCHERYASLSKIYVLAEKLVDHVTKMKILEDIFDFTRYHVTPSAIPGVESIQVVYDGTTPGDPLRRVLVRLYTDFGDSSFLTEETDTIPKDLLFELSLSMMNTRPLLRNHERLIAENKRLKKTIAKQEAELRKYPFATATVGPSEPSSTGHPHHPPLRQSSVATLFGEWR